MNFDYILSFYNNHYSIFILLLLLGVIIEWPVITFSVSLLATKLNFNFFEIWAISFFGDIVWDLIYFHIWKYIWNKFIKKDLNHKYLVKIDETIEKNHLFETLLMIKYTPPITIAGLAYLWFKKIEIKKFILSILPIIIFNSLLITSLWYFFGSYFLSSDNFSYTIIWIFFAFGLLYFIIKFLPKLFAKNE